MVVAWRLIREAFAHDPYSGEGAAKYGGRWNSKGTRVVYCSGSLSLAALELIVHQNPWKPMSYVAYRIEFDEELVSGLDPKLLPPDWRAQPVPPGTQLAGDEWVHGGKTAVLQVPSVVIPQELNFVLNPLHKDFHKIKLGKGEPFAIDPRLLSR